MNVLIVLLVLAWGVVLTPWYLRRRADGSAGSVGESLKRLSVLQGPSGLSGSRVLPGGGRSQTTTRNALARDVDPARVRARQARKRRRDVFMGLLALSIGSALLGLLMPQLFVLHAVVDVLLAGYVALLVRMRHGASRTHMAMRRMPARGVHHVSRARESAPDYAYAYVRE